MVDRRNGSGILAAGGVAALVLAGAARMDDPPNLVKVEQGFADVGPLNVDMRLQPIDLRMPMNYDAVYRGQADNGYGGTTEYFARMSGAVTAVFPRSVYTDVGEGARSVDIPAGTVFYIGELPEELTRQPEVKAPPVMRRPPTVIGSAPDSLSELPFDPEIERIAAERRAAIAADLILQAAAAERARAKP